MPITKPADIPAEWLLPEGDKDGTRGWLPISRKAFFRVYKRLERLHERRTPWSLVIRGQKVDLARSARHGNVLVYETQPLSTAVIALDWDGSDGDGRGAWVCVKKEDWDIARMAEPGSGYGGVVVTVISGDDEVRIFKTFKKPTGSLPGHFIDRIKRKAATGDIGVTSARFADIINLLSDKDEDGKVIGTNVRGKMRCSKDVEIAALAKHRDFRAGAHLMPAEGDATGWRKNFLTFASEGTVDDDEDIPEVT